MLTRTTLLAGLFVAGSALALLATEPAPLGTEPGDDFPRERKKNDATTNAKKDALEGKAPPKLEVSGWLNTPGGKPLTWDDLHGKVVLIDFWGTW